MPKSNYVESRVLAAVRAFDPGKEFRNAEIMVLLTQDGATPGVSTVSSSLRLMERKGEVYRVNRTTWRKVVAPPVAVAAVAQPQVPFLDLDTMSWDAKLDLILSHLDTLNSCFRQAFPVGGGR